MIDIDQERFIAEYRSHRHEYPEFIQGEHCKPKVTPRMIPRKGSAVIQARVVKERVTQSMVRSI